MKRAFSLILIIFVFYGCLDEEINVKKNILLTLSRKPHSKAIYDPVSDSLYKIDKIFNYPINDMYDIHSYDYLNKLFFGYKDSLYIVDLMSKNKYSVKFQFYAKYMILNNKSFLTHIRGENYLTHYSIENNTLQRDTIHNEIIIKSLYGFSSMFEINEKIYFLHYESKKLFYYDLTISKIFEDKSISSILQNQPLGNILLINDLCIIETYNNEKCLYFIEINSNKIINKISKQYCYLSNQNMVGQDQSGIFILIRESDRYRKIGLFGIEFYRFFYAVGGGDYYLLSFTDYSIKPSPIYSKYSHGGIDVEFFDKKNNDVLTLSPTNY